MKRGRKGFYCPIKDFHNNNKKLQLIRPRPHVRSCRPSLVLLLLLFRFKMSWDLAIVMPLLVYLAVMIPFRLCFDNEPKILSPSYWFEFTIELVRKGW